MVAMMKIPIILQEGPLTNMLEPHRKHRQFTMYTKERLHMHQASFKMTQTLHSGHTGLH